jgi:membrane protein
MIKFIINIAKKIKPLGFVGLSIYDVTIFFWKGLVEGAITTRASSLAFNFFLAFFPSIIVFFTLIPYIPIASLQETLMDLLSVVLPPSTNEITFNTLDDIINNPRGGLLSIGFILSLYFSSNGMSSLIEAFNSSYHINEYRSLLRQKALSITLTCFLALLLIIAIGLIIFGKVAVNYLTEFEIISKFSADLILYAKWFVMLAMLFAGISILFHFGPATKRKWKLFTPGSIIATIGIIFTSMGFNYYINHFVVLFTWF